MNLSAVDHEFNLPVLSEACPELCRRVEGIALSLIYISASSLPSTEEATSTVNW